MSILVLQSSFSGRESWLLCLICLPGVSWWLSGSSSWCHGVVCGLWWGISWFYLLFLYSEVLTTVPTTDVALNRAVITTVPTTEAVLYRAVMGSVPTIEVALYRRSNGHCSHQGGSFIQGSTDHCSPEGGSFIQSSNGHCSYHGGSLYRAVMPSNYLLETSNNWFFLFSR